MVGAPRALVSKLRIGACVFSATHQARTNVREHVQPGVHAARIAFPTLERQVQDISTTLGRCTLTRPNLRPQCSMIIFTGETCFAAVNAKF